jgi:hypothetical protein
MLNIFSSYFFLIKSKRIKLPGHVAALIVDVGNTYKILVGEPEETILLKFTSSKFGVRLCTEFNWPSVGTEGGFS